RTENRYRVRHHDQRFPPKLHEIAPRTRVVDLQLVHFVAHHPSPCSTESSHAVTCFSTSPSATLTNGSSVSSWTLTPRRLSTAPDICARAALIGVSFVWMRFAAESGNCFLIAATRASASR